MGIISDELRGWGLEESAADSFAGEFVVQQPYELETGSVLISKRLRDYGLDDSRAEDAATTLLAVSLFNSRCNLGDVGRLLRSTGVDTPTSLGAAMEASRIRREIRQSAEEEQAALVLFWRRIAPALVFTGLTALLFVMAGTIG